MNCSKCGKPSTPALPFSAQLRDISDNRERYIKAWIAETGLKPSEAMQVTATLEDGSRVYWCMKRGLPTDIDVLQAENAKLREERGDLEETLRRSRQEWADIMEREQGAIRTENAKLRALLSPEKPGSNDV